MTARGKNDGVPDRDPDVSVWIPAPPEPETAVPPADERFARLWRAYYPAVLAYATRRAGADLAGDVATATFAVLWQRIDQPPVEPLPWLYSVARRELANQRRGSRRREALRGRLAGRRLLASVDPGDTATEGMHARVALARLAEADREVLMLIAWEGLEPAQAAAVLGISPGAFAVRLHRARRRLESRLAILEEPRS